MAHTQNTNLFYTINTYVFGTAVALFNGFANVFNGVSLARTRSNMFQTMNTMSDVQLQAKYGIDRDQVVDYIFAEK